MSKKSLFGFKSLFVKNNEESNVTHQLFYKQHTVRQETDDRPSDLTLFICNIPPYYNEDAVRKIFQSCGAVESILFADLEAPSEVIDNSKKSIFDDVDETRGYKVAYAVYKSAASLEKALKWQPTKTLVLCDQKFNLLTGLKKWMETYNNSFENFNEIQQDIDSYVTEHDEEVKNKILSEKEAMEADEDGWITVSKQGKNPGLSRKRSVKDGIIIKIKKKRRRKELLNFYSFQIRESKMNHLMTIREKYEEDKKKIEQMKSNRKFRPFG